MSLCYSIASNFSTSTESQYEVNCAFFSYIVVTESSTVLELLSCEYQPLLIDWDTFSFIDGSFFVIVLYMI